MVINQTLTIKNLAKVSKELLFMLFLLALVLVLKPVKANAATLDVVAGSSAINADNSCQLEEALQNINDGASTNTDCVNTGAAYGTDDTINLPAGTINFTGSGYMEINDKSIKVIGQGRDSSIVSGVGFDLSGSGLYSALFKDFKMTSPSYRSIYVGENYDLTVESMEFDTDDGSDNTNTAIRASNSNLTIKDSYFYGVYNYGGSTSALVAVYSDDSDEASVVIENSTFEGGNSGVELYLGSSHALINATIKNSTFSGMRGNNEIEWTSATGILVDGGYYGDGSVNYTTINNTFSNMSNTGSGSSLASAIRERTDSNSTINHTAQNDLYAVGDGSSAVNLSQIDGSGIGTFTTTSLGGNISNDNSFGSRLNHTTDQNNVTTLASFLGVLSDNGGSIPTLALLDGSPAIDAGTNASSAGVITDARGISRPQGTAFDAGAYELAVAGEPDNGNNDGGNNNSGSSNTTTTTNPGLTSPSSSVSQFSNRPITITTPTGTTITSSNTVTESSLTTQDNDHQYPLGLVNFNFTTNQTDNQVTLTFITDLKPNQVKPRKYNPNTKAYTDIKDYTLTESTVDGKHALVLTYTITDNGDLDLDKTTGVISDPVGLAMTNDTYGKLANTGQNILLTALAGTTITLTAITTLYINKLRAKSPKVKHYFSI